MSGMRNWMCALIIAPVACFGTGWTGAHAQNAPQCLNASPYAISLLKKVLAETRKSFNLHRVEICKNHQVPNAYAVPFPQYAYNAYGQPVQIGFRFVLYYNPFFMGQLDVARDNEWAQLGVFAHEVGHFVEIQKQAENAYNQSWGGSFNFTSPWSRELFADEHSGRVLAGMGAAAKDIEETQRFMFTLHGSPTHPDTIKRLTALYKGYAAGGGSTDNLPTPSDISRNIYDKLSRW